MKPDIAKDWVARLRSGQYKQGGGYLRLVADDGTERHCCLGVLCEMAVEAGVIGPAFKKESNVYSYPAGLNDSQGNPIVEAGCIPQKVQQWAGMIDCLGRQEGHKMPALSTLNDDGHTFEQIATIIEESVDKL